MIPYSALVLSLKIGLFSTLQFPDLSLLILFLETYFPNCLILIRYEIVPQNVSDQSNIQRPYPHNKQLYPFYEEGSRPQELMMAFQPLKVYATTKLSFPSF